MPVSGVTIGRPGQGAGVETVVPDVVGKPEAEAIQILKNAGLRSGRRIEVEATGTVGTVFRQDPAAGEPRPKGSSVTLRIVIAPTTPPPDLGQRLDAIQSAIGDVTTAVAAVETDTAAAERQREILKKIDSIAGGSPKAKGS